jgi:hypothetical protein
MVSARDHVQHEVSVSHQLRRQALHALAVKLHLSNQLPVRKHKLAVAHHG